jgi:hypothetical protein
MMKYHRASTNTPNMGNVYREPVDNTPNILSSLEKLYKNLVENQQKI